VKRHVFGRYIFGAICRIEQARIKPARLEPAFFWGGLSRTLPSANMHHPNVAEKQKTTALEGRRTGDAVACGFSSNKMPPAEHPFV